MTDTPPIDLPALIGGATGEWTLDPAASSVEFHVKHFWGAITVHGHFDTVSGGGTVAADGTVSGEIRIAAESVNSKNKQRDKHLRSDDFFDAEAHPDVTIAATGLTPSGRDLRGEVTLTAAGHQHPVDAVITVVSTTADAVTLRAEATVDRTAFDMTWSPLRIAAPHARVVVTAHFTRS